MFSQKLLLHYLDSCNWNTFTHTHPHPHTHKLSPPSANITVQVKPRNTHEYFTILKTHIFQFQKCHVHTQTQHYVLRACPYTHTCFSILVRPPHSKPTVLIKSMHKLPTSLNDGWCFRHTNTASSTNTNLFSPNHL